MDFMGPFPTTVNESRQILVFVNDLTCYTEIVPVKVRIAVTVAEAIRHRIITRHSCLEYCYQIILKNLLVNC